MLRQTRFYNTNAVLVLVLAAEAQSYLNILGWLVKQEGFFLNETTKV